MCFLLFTNYSKMCYSPLLLCTLVVAPTILEASLYSHQLITMTFTNQNRISEIISGVSTILLPVTSTNLCYQENVHKVAAPVKHSHLIFLNPSFPVPNFIFLLDINCYAKHVDLSGYCLHTYAKMASIYF